jgi:hypothetical protein
MSIRSRVNQPERVFLNSSDDNTNATTTGFSSFRCTFDTPILGAKRCQMLRATVPNCLVNIPDYQLMFWYYNLPAATTVPTDANLECIRLYPSWAVPASALGSAFTKNRPLTGPADLCTLLNAAASPGGDSITYNPYWSGASAQDVSFAFNTSTLRITMTGLSSGRFYAIAGYNDPLVVAANSGLGAQGAITNSLITYNVQQPFATGYTLNLRAGYAMSGSSIDDNNDVAGNTRYANLTNTTFAQNAGIPPDSFPNLVYTQCIYLYSNIVAGSSLGSGRQHDLLTVMSNNAAALGVASFVSATVTWLTKIPSDIYEIEVRMLDDANQPLVLPDNAQVNLELAFHYGTDDKISGWTNQL